MFGKTLCSVKWVTVRLLITKLAPGGFRQGDKTSDTLDPCRQTVTQVKPENCRFKVLHLSDLRFRNLKMLSFLFL